MVNDNTSNVLLQTALALSSFHLSKILYINANIEMAVNVPCVYIYIYLTMAPSLFSSSMCNVFRLPNICNSNAQRNS